MENLKPTCSEDTMFLAQRVARQTLRISRWRNHDAGSASRPILSYRDVRSARDGLRALLLQQQAEKQWTRALMEEIRKYQDRTPIPAPT